MTVRQSLLKLFYPLLMQAGKMFGLRASVLENGKNIEPVGSFYNLSTQLINGAKMSFNEFKGKNVLIVNTASGCGYTSQMSDLKKLQESYKSELVIIGFPSNDFKEQEKLSDKEIASFCALNFGVSFLLAKKSVVTQGKEQNEVFAWLTDKGKNGWNEKAPEWNFSKYLINRKGILINYFGPGIDPLSNDVTKKLV